MSHSGKLAPGTHAVIHGGAYGLCILVLLLGLSNAAQSQDASSLEDKPNSVSRGVGYLVNYLNMAGATKASDFQPMSQRERTDLYWKTMANPLGFAKAGFSAGADQWNNKPSEWQQGAAGYGQRYANILGQYSIQRTVTYGLSSLFHEDNRYFNSGKHGFWNRTGYALESGLVARHDDGSRHISISQLGGVAAGAFVSRLWLPASQNTAGDAAVSFGITMGWNMGFGVVKELLPDLGNAIKKRKKRREDAGKQISSSAPASSTPRVSSDAASDRWVWPE
jgi:hypothetical protein